MNYANYLDATMYEGGGLSQGHTPHAMLHISIWSGGGAHIALCMHWGEGGTHIACSMHACMPHRHASMSTTVLKQQSTRELCLPLLGCATYVPRAGGLTRLPVLAFMHASVGYQPRTQPLAWLGPSMHERGGPHHAVCMLCKAYIDVTWPLSSPALPPALSAAPCSLGLRP